MALESVTSPAGVEILRYLLRSAPDRWVDERELSDNGLNAPWFLWNHPMAVTTDRLDRLTRKSRRTEPNPTLPPTPTARSVCLWLHRDATDEALASQLFCLAMMVGGCSINAFGKRRPISRTEIETMVLKASSELKAWRLRECAVLTNFDRAVQRLVATGGWAYRNGVLIPTDEAIHEGLRCFVKKGRYLRGTLNPFDEGFRNAPLAAIAASGLIPGPVFSNLTRQSMSSPALASLPTDPNTRLFSYDDWLALPDHPRQRNTRAHAARAVDSRKGHLFVQNSRHVDVKAAVHPLTQTLHKVDGHTRTFLWEHNPKWSAEKPATLIVKVHEPLTEDDFVALYYENDNPGAIEHAAASLSGIFRDLGFHFTSSRLKKATGVLTAFRIAMGVQTRPVEKLAATFDEWRDEIDLMDQCDFTAHNAMIGTVAAALLSFRQYDAQVLPFWQKVARGEGNMENGKRDAVAFAIKISDTARNGRSSEATSWDLTRRLLSCCDRYIRGDAASLRAPSPLPIAEYRDKANKAKALRI